VNPARELDSCSKDIPLLVQYLPNEIATAPLVERTAGKNAAGSEMIGKAAGKRMSSSALASPKKQLQNI
jgi:hypothetical protein